MNQCFVCKTNIDHKPSTARICGKPDCVRERNRIKANKHGHLKLWGKITRCVVCGKMFNKSATRYKICGDKVCRDRRIMSYSTPTIITSHHNPYQKPSKK